MHELEGAGLGISNIAKFGCEMLSNTENIALQSWQIPQICILLYYVRELVTKFVTNFRM